VIRDLAAGAVWGKGPDGYREALDILRAAIDGTGSERRREAG
jgi:hypothetical protein